MTSSPEPRYTTRVGSGGYFLAVGDLTKWAGDAIVNAANSSLLGGGGVDGAIHRAGGPAILEECRAIRARQGGCAPGEAVLTTGGTLPARYVIHTVGPVWQGGAADEAATLERCYRGSLALAVRNGLRSVAFPSISTGAFGYPVDLAAAVAQRAIRDALAAESALEYVGLVLFDEKTFDAYRREALGIMP